MLLSCMFVCSCAYVYMPAEIYFLCVWGCALEVCKVCAGVTGKLIHRCFELEIILVGVMVLLRPIAIHTEIDFHNIHSTCVPGKQELTQQPERERERGRERERRTCIHLP